MTKLIKDWRGLVGLESDNYILEIDLGYCNGWIKPKVETEQTEENYFDHHIYLSTHTFYGGNYKYSTVLLQEYGFDVQLENWDGETEEVNYRDQWLWSGKCEHCRRKEYCNTECKAAKRYKEHLKTLEQIRNMGR